MDEEIIELQTRLSFQEDIIQALSDIVTRQQLTLDRMKLDLEELRLQVRALTPSDVAGMGEETPPPHY